MPFVSDNPNHKPFSVKKLSYDDIQNLIEMRYPSEEDVKPTPLVDICVWIKNKFDMEISVSNLHTFIKKKRLSKRIRNAKESLKEIELAKMVDQSKIDRVIDGCASLLLDISQEHQSPTAFSTVVNSLTRWKEVQLKEKELELKRQIQKDGQNININANNTSPTKETLAQLSAEIGLL